jgi:hypothetical protein
MVVGSRDRRRDSNPTSLTIKTILFGPGKLRRLEILLPSRGGNQFVKSIQMSRSDNVTSYFMMITQTRDQLATIGEKVHDVELISVELNGFPKSWEPFVKGIHALEKLPNWEKLWDDCIQEKTQESSKANKQEDGEKNLAPVSQAKKSKGKGSKGNNEGETS